MKTIWSLLKRHEQTERGFTLVELLVYILLLGVVTTILATFMINSFRTQSLVTDTQQTSNQAQSLISSVDIAVRNSAPLKSGIDDVSLGADRQLLYVSNTKRSNLSVSGTPTTDWQSSYWIYDSSSQEIWTKTASSQVSDFNTSSGWSKIVSNVANEPSVPVFSIYTASWDAPSATPTPTSTSSGDYDVPTQPIKVHVNLRVHGARDDSPDVLLDPVLSGLPIDSSTAIDCH